MKNKKMLAWIMAMALGATCMSGCGGQNQNEDSGEAKESGGDGEVVEIHMANWRTEEIEAFEEINAEFMKEYPNIRPVYDAIKATEYDSKISIDLQNGTAADLIYVRPFDRGCDLYEAGRIPESAKEAIKKAKKEGHLLFINTGRTRTSLPQKVTSLGFDGYVCGCGTNIYLGDKELLSVKLSNELCTQVAQTVRKYKVPVFYEASDAIYFDYQLPRVVEYVSGKHLIQHQQGHNR